MSRLKKSAWSNLDLALRKLSDLCVSVVDVIRRGSTTESQHIIHLIAL